MPASGAVASKSRRTRHARTSPASGPLIACSTSIASSTVRVIGPSLSSDQHSVIAPVRATRPNVGRRPVTPQRIAGLTMLPPVSLPIEKRDQRRRGRRAGSGARSRRALLQQPRVHRLSAEPDVVERECAERQLRDEHGACLVESAHDHRVRSRHAIAERFGAVGGGDVLRVEQVLHAVRDAVQRAAILPGGDLGIRRFARASACSLRDRDDRAELRIEPLDATQGRCSSGAATVSCRDSIHRESCVTGANAMASSEEGKRRAVGVRRTKRSRDGPAVMPGSIGFQSVAGASVWRDGDLPRPGAALESTAPSTAAMSGGLLPLGRRHGHLHQLFRFGKCRGRHIGARDRRRCRRSAVHPAVAWRGRWFEEGGCRCDSRDCPRASQAARGSETGGECSLKESVRCAVGLERRI